MFKGLSPFKPFVGSFFFGQLLAQFQVCGKCSKAQIHLSHLVALSIWSIVGPISSLRQMFQGPSPFKPFVGSFLFGSLSAQFQA
jgi:hypothetical protein